jgi:hypothetical protein
MRLSDSRVQQKMNDIGEPRVKRSCAASLPVPGCFADTLCRTPWNPRAAPAREGMSAPAIRYLTVKPIAASPGERIR